MRGIDLLFPAIRWRRRPVGGLCSWPALLLALLAAQDARAADPRRVVVRITDAADRALMQRIRGQTSDLDVQLFEVDQPPMEPRITDELATAGRLADRLGARIVIWFAAGSDSLTLFFSIPQDNRTFVRTMDKKGGAQERSQEPMPGSAMLEAAALVVRSVVQALANGATIGVTLAKPLDEPAPSEVPSRAIPAPGWPDAAGPQPSASLGARRGARAGASPPLAWLLGVGWHGSLESSTTWMEGIQARAGLGYGPLSWGLAFALDAPIDLRDRYATVRLSRGSASAFAAYGVTVGEAIRLDLGVAAGAVTFPRQTIDPAAGVAHSASVWDSSAFVGPEIGLSVRARWQKTYWGVGFRAGADVLMTPPIIGYEVQGAFVAEHVFWSVQPTAAVLLEVGSR